MKGRELLSLALTAVTVLAMTGCSQNEITDLSPEANPAISFGAYTGTQTRGTETTTGTVQNDGFGILAYDYQVDWISKDETPNFMYNQKVEYKASAWTYAPVKYWPNTAGNRITFFAYAPYESTPATGASKGIVLSANTAGYNPTITFTVKDAATDMVDLVVDNEQVRKTSASGTVNFNFKHILSRVDLAVKADRELASGTSIVVTGIKIIAAASPKFYKSCVYTSDISKIPSQSGDTWAQTGTTFPTDYDLAGVLKKADTGITGYPHQGIKVSGMAEMPLLQSGQYLFLIPVMGLQEGQIQLQFDYDLVSNGTSDPAKPVINHSTQTVKLPAGDLAKGTAHKYTFQIGMNEVKVSQSVEEWGGDTDIDLSAPLYNGKYPNLLAIPGQTAYWVAPENASGGIPWTSIDFKTICPAGWHVPTKDDFTAMTGHPADANQYGDNYAAIAAAFPGQGYYWSSTTHPGNASGAWYLYVGRQTRRSGILWYYKTDTYVVRCVRVK